ncbi:MAG: phosphatase [Eubacteriales bacterium]|nr:phosphatase [Eubacteriales bacterium]
MKDVLDVHTHTLSSGHAYNTIWEMAKGAADKGLDLLGITDHGPQMPGSCHEFYFSNIKAVPRKLFDISVLFGVELNITDYEGTVDLREEYLKQMDLAIASLHIPCIKPGTAEQNTRAYIKAMENPYINIIGHPDDGRYAVNYKELVLAAKEHGVLLEINDNSLNPNGFRQNTVSNDRLMLELCKEYKVPVIMNSDAHVVTDIGKHQRAQAIIKEVNFPEELVVNRSVDELMKYINYGKRNG